LTKEQHPTFASPFLQFLGIAFSFSWACWLPAALGSHGLIDVPAGLNAVGAFGPGVAALIVAGGMAGRGGAMRLLLSLFSWGARSMLWPFAAMVVSGLVVVAALCVHVIAGGEAPSLHAFIGIAPQMAASFAYMLVAVAFGEELGWRGMALPLLQRRLGALSASMVLGVVWAAWHAPLFLNRDTHYYNVRPDAFLFLLVGHSIIASWLFNCARGWVLVPMLFHAALNASSSVWRIVPGFDRQPASSSESAALNQQVYVALGAATWLSAVLIVAIWGGRNLSRISRLQDPIPRVAGSLENRSATK
jgi:membrane protease YdiL (CAAX protease family)